MAVESGRQEFELWLHSWLILPVLVGAVKVWGENCVNVFVRCIVVVLGACVSHHIIPPLVSLRALGDNWHGCPAMANSAGVFPPWGRGGSREKSAKWSVAWKCAQFVDIISLVSSPLQTRASLSPSLRHPALPIMSVTHMVPGRGHLHSTALSGEHLLTLPAWCLPTSASPLPGFLLNQPISSNRLWLLWTVSC